MGSDRETESPNNDGSSGEQGGGPQPDLLEALEAILGVRVDPHPGGLSAMMSTVLVAVSPAPEEPGTDAPEASTYLLIGSGLVGLVALRKRLAVRDV